MDCVSEGDVLYDAAGRIGIVGCGFVADLYMKTLKAYPALQVVGVHDRDRKRAEAFSRIYRAPVYESLKRLLDQAKPDIVLNLTNPEEHASVSAYCLDRGIHVYSEKPLATEYEAACELVEQANERGVFITGAPCTILSENAQTMWRAIRRGRVGATRLAYAELDDGFVPKMAYRQWRNSYGVPWPAEDEFRAGCTLEHAGYALSWLCAYFGPVEKVAAYATGIVPGKDGCQDGDAGPDFSVACLTFSDGMVARLTCSIVAPHNHQVTVVGDDGILRVDESWRARGPVYLRKRHRIGNRVMLAPWKRRVPLAGRWRMRPVRYGGAQRVDFARGVADLAKAVQHERQPYLSPAFVLHVNEVSLAIHQAQETGITYRPETGFAPLAPLPWAR